MHLGDGAGVEEQMARQQAESMAAIQAARVMAATPPAQQQAASANPDTRPAAERAAADAQVRRMSDQEVRDAVHEPRFSGALYLKNNPDVAAHPTWGKDPARHYLAYGQYENRPYPDSGVTATPLTPTTPPLPTQTSTMPVKVTYTDIPGMPPIPSFAPAPTIAQTLNPLATNSMQLTPGRTQSQGIDRELEREAQTQAQSSLPPWAIPVGLAAAALLLISLLTGSPSPAPAPAPAKGKKGK